VSQLTLYNAARPPPGPPELRRLRSVGRVPPPGILRRFTPPRNCGHSGSRRDCRLKAASQERRLQPADELHNPAIPASRPRGTVSAGFD
jgi:hypothetical protein